MTDYIYDKAKQLVKTYDTKDPFRIAKQLGIEVIYKSDFNRLKGMYSVIFRNRFIFINDNLPKSTKIIVCSHELGHDSFHREIAKSSVLQEYMLYDIKTRTEYEANVFAAHLQLDENEILELETDGFDIFQIAMKLNTDINLLLIKLHEMNRQGYKFNLPYIPNSNFLGKN